MLGGVGPQLSADSGAGLGYDLCFTKAIKPRR